MQCAATGFDVISAAYVRQPWCWRSDVCSPYLSRSAGSTRKYCTSSAHSVISSVLFFFYLLLLIRLSFGRQAKVGDDQPFFPHEFYDVLEDLLYFLCVSWVIRLWVFNLCYLMCVSVCYTFSSFCKCILSVEFAVIMTRDWAPLSYAATTRNWSASNCSGQGMKYTTNQPVQFYLMICISLNAS